MSVSFWRSGRGRWGSLGRRSGGMGGIITLGGSRSLPLLCSSFLHSLTLYPSPHRRHSLRSRRFGLGNVYMQTGKYRLAEYHFRKAAEINPTNATLVCCVGSVRFLSLPFFPSLSSAFARPLPPSPFAEPRPEPPPSRADLLDSIQVLEKLGRRIEALELYEKACVLAPQSPAVRFKRVRILIALRQFEVRLRLSLSFFARLGLVLTLSLLPSPSLSPTLFPLPLPPALARSTARRIRPPPSQRPRTQRIQRPLPPRQALQANVLSTWPPGQGEGHVEAFWVGPGFGTEGG